MEIHELVIEMKLLERHLTLYEEKYGSVEGSTLSDRKNCFDWDEPVS